MIQNKSLTWTAGTTRAGFHAETNEVGGHTATIAVAATPSRTFGVARCIYRTAAGGDALDQLVKSEVAERDDYLAACIAAEQFRRSTTAAGLAAGRL